MTEGLVFECFYTRRYRPLRGKMTTFMAVIFLWQFPPLYFAIFSGNSNPDSLFLLFGLPESPNGNSHPYFLPFYPKRAILAPYFCYFARRNGLEAAQAQPASGKQRQNGVGRPAEAARPQQKERQSTYRSTSRSSRSTSSTSSAPGHGRAQKNDNLSGCRHFGAENGARTRDLNLGKVALYQLSYFRVRFPDWDCKYTTIF